MSWMTIVLLVCVFAVLGMVCIRIAVHPWSVRILESPLQSATVSTGVGLSWQHAAYLTLERFIEGMVYVELTSWCSGNSWTLKMFLPEA